MAYIPWLEDYQKYMVGIVKFENTNLYPIVGEYEIIKIGIVFKFPNGYHVIVEFGSFEVLDGYCEEKLVYMDVNVEMLDKNGEKFSKDAYEKEKNDRFPKSKRQEFMETHEVEEFLEKVMNI